MLLAGAVAGLGLGARDQAAAPAPGGHGGPIRALATLHDGTVATGGFDARVIVWDLALGSATRVLRHHDSAVNALAALAGACVLSGGEDGRVALWCGGQDAPPRVLETHTAPVAALAVAADRSLVASGSWAGEVRLRPIAGEGDAATGTRGGRAQGAGGRPRVCAGRQAAHQREL